MKIKNFAFCLLVLSLFCVLSPAHAAEGSDLEFGGPGSTNGKFGNIRDITFDSQNVLYVLDVIKPNAEAKIGVGRVQKFDANGKFLTQFSTLDESFASEEKDQPARIAVDGAGNAYVSKPVGGVVQQFAPDGKAGKRYEIPDAFALTSFRGGERIAVVASRAAIVNGRWQQLGGDQIHVLAPEGQIEATIPLAQRLKIVRDIAADKAGNFYVLGSVHDNVATGDISAQLWKFDAMGKIVRVLGTGQLTRAQDGSELIHSVALDSQDNIYSMTWGNGGYVVKFDPAFQTVSRRQGKFSEFEAWSIHSSYTPLALDANDRLWVASTPGPTGRKERPVIVRARTDFLQPSGRGVSQGPVALLGFAAEVQANLVESISYDLKPIALQFVVKPNKREIETVGVAWRVVDALGTQAGKGRFDVPLQNGVEAKQNFTWTPPRFGWYSVVCDVMQGEKVLQTFAKHVGVSPAFAGLETLEAGESVWGWEDAPRTMWTGLPNMRLHPEKGLDKLDSDLKLAEKYGATVIVQLVDGQQKFKPEEVRAMMQRFKGRIKYIEVCNEPNYSGGIESYFKIHKEAYEIVKAIDPAVKVMGPATVNVDLNWLRKLYEMGLKDVSDIISIHDYEGHETIDPVHWRWKYGAARKIMAEFGDGAKPIWQTEHAFSAMRGGNMTQVAQAARVMLHADLLETLGIPREHNNLYYLNEGGFASVPTYVWSRRGPFATALALRTRYAMTKGQKYLGSVDFGPQGNEVFMALRYNGANGQTISFRNMGTQGDVPLEVTVKGAGNLEVMDSWGNVQAVPVRAGKATLASSQLPQYLRLKAGQDVTFPVWNWKRNIAPDATIAVSSALDKGRDNSWLTNGVLETMQEANPDGGTNGDKIWAAAPPENGVPTILEMTWPRPQNIARMMIFGVEADNQFAALLDYDVEAWQNGAWKTLAKVRANIPETFRVDTGDARSHSFYQRTNRYVHQFAPISTDRLRLVVHRTTFGFAPDAVANQVIFNEWGGTGKARVTLREIQVFEALGRK